MRPELFLPAGTGVAVAGRCAAACRLADVVVRAYALHRLGGSLDPYLRP